MLECGGVVPQGMSICVSCGVDQETGLRVGLEDDLVPPPPPAPSGPPLHVAIIGGLLGVAGLTLLILSLIRSVGGAEGGRITAGSAWPSSRDSASSPPCNSSGSSRPSC